MKKLFVAALLVISSSAQADTFTEAQAKEICRMVDPTFLKNVAVVMEAKAAGKARKRIVYAVMKTGHFAMSGTGGALYLTQLEEAYDAPNVKTAAEAVAFTEAQCLRGVLGANSD